MKANRKPGIGGILVCALWCAIAAASEPDGRVAFRHEWADPAPGTGDGRVLHLSVRATVDIDDAVLLFETPSGVSIELGSVQGAGVPAVQPVPGVSPGRVELGSLGRGDTRILEFRCRHDVPGGIASFRLRGVATGGRPFEEGEGVVVGLPSPAPQLRSGAEEFPSGAARR